MAGGASTVVGEVEEDVFQDETTMNYEGFGDETGGGGEEALEVEDDSVGGVGAAVLEVGDGFGVSGDDPEGAEGGGFGRWGCGGGELPGTVGSLAEVGGRVRGKLEGRGGRVVAEGASGDGSAGVDAELEAGAGLGVVAIEDAEVLDVGGLDL